MNRFRNQIYLLDARDVCSTATSSNSSIAEVFLTNHRQSQPKSSSPITDKWHIYADVIFLLSITEIHYILNCLLKSAQVADVSTQALGEEWRHGNR